ncbi:pyridoxal phosphate-dependent aminotransferase [Chthonobacter rhizosphaerae]|uniref:pyridoxal phosphate-dependent aminotransferase n=1 Tax=Chthonobacter rhizosphaerae TaxID=2735553 RepID=UPI0015EEFB31|nr:aminotransferase class I/II-fold pyridoxal phosphate-dependent enzyme [Chthonobacter rhizosphaerae]
MPRRLSQITERTSGRGADAWVLHTRAKAAKARGEDVIVLSVGDPDMDTPAPVVDAAVAALKAGDTHYTETLGRDSLRDALAARHARMSGDRVTAAHVAVTSGAQNALFLSALVLLEPGDHVLLLDPVYVTYPATFEATGASVTYVTQPAETGFRLDAGRLEAAVRPNTKAIAFANPNNPTGVSFTRADLEAIAAVAVKHDLWVVVDEVYGDLTFDAPFVPAASVPDLRPRLLSVGSFSKAFAMTGWRCGFLVAPPDVIEAVARISVAMLYGLPGFIQEAALTALAGGGAIEADMKAIYRRRRDLAAAALAEVPLIRAATPDAGMFMMVDVSRTGLSGAAFAARLYAATGVSVLDGAAFSDLLVDYVRLSFAVHDDDLLEGCRRIRRFVDQAAADR